MTNEALFYMRMAEHIATASRAERLKVGAVLVKEDNVISVGYNGTPAGFNNACEVNGQTKPEVLHAESNAIAKCARSTQSSDGSTLYTTVSPCFECAKLVIQAGIKTIVFKDYYRDIEGLVLLQLASIRVYRVYSDGEIEHLNTRDEILEDFNLSQ
jgi:dCMP deaminase